jgi:hypothetical protein
VSPTKTASDVAGEQPLIGVTDLRQILQTVAPRSRFHRGRMLPGQPRDMRLMANFIDLSVIGTTVTSGFAIMRWMR